MRKQVLAATVWVLSGCHGAPPIGEHTSPIIGGTVDNGDPAVLLLIVESQQGTMICTGSLIAPDVVLTAGHCVSESGQYFAFFGTDANQMQGDIVDVTEVHPHPQFNANTLDNDIGVAILAQPVPLAPLPINTAPMTATAAGQATRLVGYGITAGGQQQGGGVKMQVVSKVMKVEPDALFIGAPGKQACEGDSGGPAFMMIGGKEIIVATTSGGDDSCNQGGYHTRVDVHVQFLQKYLGTLPPTPPVPPNGPPTPPTPPNTPPSGGDEEEPDFPPSAPPPSAATQAPAKPPVVGGCSMSQGSARSVGLLWLVLFAVFVRSRRAAMVLAAALVLGCAPPAPTPAPNNQAPVPGDTTPKPAKDMGEPMMPPGAEPDPDEDGVFPLTAYTGYDGMHSYQVPMATSLKGTIAWSMSDATLADVVTIANTKIPMDLQQIPGLQWSMLTAKKAGMGKVTATVGAKSASADVVITAYTAAQYTAGQTKYMATCAGCHSGAGGVDHSPTILEFNPDAELLLAITTGAYSDGYKLRAPNHAFTLTEAEKGGIIAYIRALPPKDFLP